MKKIYLYILLFFSYSFSLQAQSWAWVKEISPEMKINARKVGLDNKLIVSGSYTSSFNVNGISFNPSVGVNCMGYISKFDTSGNCLWQNSITVGYGCYNPNGNPTRVFFQVDIMDEDSQGNIYMGGWFEGCGIDFGNGVSSTDAGQEMFLAKYNSTGQCLWAKMLPEANDGNGQMKGSFYDIDIDAQDNIYLVQFKYTYPQTFYNYNFTSKAQHIIKLNSNGDALWAKVIPNTTNSYALIKMVYKDDFIYSACQFIGNPTIAGQTYTSSGGTDVLLIKMDTLGNELDSKLIDGTSNETALEITITADNKIIMLSNTQSNSINLGSNVLNTDTNHSKYFLASYDTSLNLINYKNIGDNSSCIGFSNLVADGLGNFYTTVSHNNSTMFDGFSGSSTQYSIVKYNSSLQTQWVDGSGGGILADNANNIYITRYIYSPTDFGPFNVTAGTGNEKLVMAKVIGAGVGHAENIKQNNASVFPNPSNNGLYNVVLPANILATNEIEIKLYNSLGQLIENVNYILLNNKTINLNLSDKTPGNYLLNIKADDIWYQAKIVR